VEGFYFTTPLARSSYALVLDWFLYDRQYRYDRYKKTLSDRCDFDRQAVSIQAGFHKIAVIATIAKDGFRMIADATIAERFFERSQRS